MKSIPEDTRPPFTSICIMLSPPSHTHTFQPIPQYSPPSLHHQSPCHSTHARDGLGCLPDKLLLPERALVHSESPLSNPEGKGTSVVLPRGERMHLSKAVSHKGQGKNLHLQAQHASEYRYRRCAIRAAYHHHALLKGFPEIIQPLTCRSCRNV